MEPNFSEELLGKIMEAQKTERSVLPLVTG